MSTCTDLDQSSKGVWWKESNTEGRCGKGAGGWPIIFSTSCSELVYELRKAASCWMKRGTAQVETSSITREGCLQQGPCMGRLDRCLWLLGILGWCCHCSGGIGDVAGRTYLKNKRELALWSEKQERSKMVCNCNESLKSDKRLTTSFSFSIQEWRSSSQKEGGPMGEPKRTKPSLVEGMSGGRLTGTFASFSGE